MAQDIIVVTGGAGFVGSTLCERLISDGNRVVCVDNFAPDYPRSEKEDNVASLRSHARFDLVEADVYEPERLQEIVARTKPDAVVHLAARTGVRGSVEDPFGHEMANVRGTLSVLEACRRVGVRKLVFGSSSSIYGTNVKVPFAETDAVLEQISPYAATKLGAEAMCNAYAALYDLDIASTRLFTVYGPRQRPDLAIRKFATRILEGRTITLYGDGSSSRDYTYVDDIVAGLVGALHHPTRGHEVFNLGHSTPVELGELVKGIEAALGQRASIEYAPMQPGDVPATYADISKARDAFGYSPATSLESGLAAFAGWLRSRWSKLAS